MFADLFGGFFGGGGGRGGRETQKRTPDVQYQLGVTLAEFYTGKVKKLKLDRDVICLDCLGRGSQKENAVQNCDNCQGRGMEIITRRLGPGMIQQMQRPCEKCKGRGEIVSDKDRCKTCKGEKVLKKEQVLEVHVDKGAKPGQKVTFREAADQAPGADSGDVVVILMEKPDPSRGEGKEGKNKKPRVSKTLVEPITPTFKRINGDDLSMEYDINLAEALLGFEIAFKHLDDRIVIVKSPEAKITSPGDVMVVETEGMPQTRNPVLKGDLYIRFNIIMPTKEDLKNDSVRKQLTSILPQVPQLPDSVKTNSEIQHYIANPFDEQLDARNRNRGGGGRNHHHTQHAYEEDDEEHQGQQTQCRTQ